VYLVANNLYGCYLNQLLPVGGFQWVNFELDEVLTTPDDPPEGYVLSIGTRTTELRVQEQWLSDYQRKLVNVLGWASHCDDGVVMV